MAVYDKNTDYKALMDAAIAAGDYKSAAQYQQQRNAKIAGEGITDYKQTFDLGSVYDANFMTNEELGRAYSARKAGEDGTLSYPHSYVEGIRSRYGYSGGSDGSEFIPLNGGSPTGGGSWGGTGGAPSYVNRYQSQIDGLTAKLLGRDPFEYDPETDPLYQQYRQSYTRGGKLAMQDTLGQLSARTGGLASSYAGGAAQQTYDSYMSGLADKIPELQQLAYSMYKDDWDWQRDNMSMLQSLEQGDYNKYLTQLGQYNTDREFNRGVYESDREFNYGTYRDSINDKRYENEYKDSRDDVEWQRLNYSSEQEYERALQKAQLLAAAGDFSGYKALGYTDAEIATLKRAYDRAQAVIPSSGGSRGGGGGYSGSGSGGRGGTGGTTQNSGIVDTMLGFGNDTKAYEYLIGLGYSNAKSDTLWEMYLTARDSVDGGSGGDSGGGYSLKDLNTNSVLSLGIGPISYTKLEQLVEQGKVVTYTDSNGKLSVRWANGYNANNYKGSGGGTKDMFDLRSQLDKMLGR